VDVATIVYGICFHVDKLTAVPVNDLIVIAFLCEAPVLVVLEVVADGSLVDVAAVLCGPALHLEALTAAPVNEPVVTVDCFEHPMLALGAGVAHLHGVVAVGRQGLTAVAGKNLVPHACRRCLTGWRRRGWLLNWLGAFDGDGKAIH